MAAVPDQILGKQNALDADPGETQEWLQALPALSLGLLAGWLVGWLVGWSFGIGCG